MLALFPQGFEEVDGGDRVELVVYTDAAGERRLRAAFSAVEAVGVPAGWEERWRAFHRGVRIGRLWVGPPWEQPPADAVAVAIEPGPAFGTGAHPTTRLCLELLQELPRASVLDVGCGSGVLAVAAARLGFAPVVAVDHDAAAVAATAANARAHGVEIESRALDVLAAPLPPADVALANVSRAVIEAVAARLDASLLVASGYLAREQPALPAWRHVERRVRDGWAGDLFARA